MIGTIVNTLLLLSLLLLSTIRRLVNHHLTRLTSLPLTALHLRHPYTLSSQHLRMLLVLFQVIQVIVLLRIRVLKLLLYCYCVVLHPSSGLVRLNLDLTRS